MSHAMHLHFNKDHTTKTTWHLICLYSSTMVMMLLLGGCAAFEEKAGPQPILNPQERVFYGPFENVWRATLLALQSPTSYPLRVNNIDTGLIETEPQKGAEAWIPPQSTTPPTSGYSSRLLIRVVRGNLGPKSAIKVTVRKDAKIQRDFFSTPEPVVSDGLEEKVILYRIEREIQIDRALQRAHQRGTKGT